MADNGILEIRNQTFIIGAKDGYQENMLLNGKYAIKQKHINPILVGKEKQYLERPEKYFCKASYHIGNILYKTDEEDVWPMIDLIIEATHVDKLSTAVDSSVHANKKDIFSRGSTICPSIETIFAYKGKLFALYGRYIYGYDEPYVCFLNKRNEPLEWPSKYPEEEEVFEKPVLSVDKIILPVIPYDDNLETERDDYNFCFRITDKASGELVAFSVYC